MEWSYAPRTSDGGRADKEKDGVLDFKELYERAREATREAQRQGDAQLKAAMAAATAVVCNPVRLCPVSLRFSNIRLERAYWRKSSIDSGNNDAIPFACQFLVHITLISLLLQGRQGSRSAASKEEVAFLQLSSFLTRLVSYLWVASICAMVLVIQLWFSSWYRGNRGTILLIVATLLWIEEGVTFHVSLPILTSDSVLIAIQCIFMSVLHRVPFCVHLKTRALGFGLQIFGTFARVRVDEAIPALLFISMGHFFGIALAYVLDQHARAVFLRSLPRCILDEVSGGGSSMQFLPYRASLSRQMWDLFYPELFESFKGDANVLHMDCQVGHNQTPRRALGGFAGGFGGVSSLKGTYTPSIVTVSSSSHNISGEDFISELSCSSTPTIDNSMDEFSSRHKYFLHHSSIEDQGQSSSRYYRRSNLKCSAYRRFSAGARDRMGH